MSCIGLCDLVTNSQAETTLVSAASSSLGKSIIGYLHLRHPQINVIGMTRSSQHDAELIGLGAK